MGSQTRVVLSINQRKCLKHAQIGGPDTHANLNRLGACRHKCTHGPLGAAEQALAAVEEILGISRRYVEHFRVRSMKVGGSVGAHTDYIPSDVPTLAGPRLFSFFVYLNDVTEGGTLWFPNLDMGVQPRMGSAVLFPDTERFDAWQRNFDSVHMVLNVTEGPRKSFLNAVHLYPFRDEFPVDM